MEVAKQLVRAVRAGLLQGAAGTARVLELPSADNKLRGRSAGGGLPLRAGVPQHVRGVRALLRWQLQVLCRQQLVRGVSGTLRHARDGKRRAGGLSVRCGLCSGR